MLGVNWSTSSLIFTKVSFHVILKHVLAWICCTNLESRKHIYQIAVVNLDAILWLLLEEDCVSMR